MGRDRDCGRYSKQHGNALCRERFDSVDIVETVDNNITDMGGDGRPDVIVGLGVAVHDNRGWICPGRERDTQFTSTYYVAAHSFLGEDSNHRDGWE